MSQEAVIQAFSNQVVCHPYGTNGGHDANLPRPFENIHTQGQVQFSADDKLLLPSSSDGTSSLWDVKTGDVLRRYGNGWIMKFIFSENGRQVLAGYRNGALELWRMDRTLDELLSWTEANRYIPELTCNQRALYNVEPLCESEE